MNGVNYNMIYNFNLKQYTFLYIKIVGEIAFLFKNIYLFADNQKVCEDLELRIRLGLKM
jgi:hypothetical protein